MLGDFLLQVTGIYFYSVQFSLGFFRFKSLIIAHGLGKKDIICAKVTFQLL